MKDNIEPMAVMISPNPSDGRFIVTLAPGQGRVEVYNLLGEVVYHSEVTSQKYTLDLSGHTRGLYFIRISSGRRIITEKIVIQ